MIHAEKDSQGMSRESQCPFYEQLKELEMYCLGDKTNKRCSASGV